MAATTLTKTQRTLILKMLGERSGHADIIAAVKKAGGVCTLNTIGYYVGAYGGQIDKARREYDNRFIGQGLCDWRKRVESLMDLESLLREDLFRKADKGKDPNDKGGLYYKDVKISPLGNAVEIYVPNTGMIKEWRGVLDDIAKETGGRKIKTEVSGVDGNPIAINLKGYVNVSPDDWDNRTADEQ